MANRFLDDPNRDLDPVDELDHDAAAAEADELRAALERWNRAYYLEGEPEVSDTVWDRLFARLQEIEERFDDLEDPASPTHRVGVDPVDELESVEHEAPMLSLNAVLETGEAQREFERLEADASQPDGPLVVAEPKIDGLSLEAVYDDGRLVRAATRGDGRTGDDVTENARTIRSLPLRLSGSPPAHLSVRGEVVLRRDEFVAINRARLERGDEPFANPRNAAAGAIRQLDSRAVARIPLDIICYDVLAGAEEVSSHGEELDLLSELGLPVSELNRPLSTFGELDAYRAQLLEERDDLPVELDGVVVKLNDLGRRDVMGVRDRTPRWAYAWKFPPRQGRTRVREIAATVGRTGKLTPVALLDPTEIGGVTVSRVSLHNADEVDRLDVRTGDLIRVERAGDVIPHVVERVPERGRERSEPFSMPSSCPACGTGVVRDGAYHRCPNGLGCPAQLAGAIEHYGSREALDIEHLGEKTAALLVEAGLVETLSDLYRLGADEVRQLEGFADRSARQLVDAIAASRNPPLDRFIFALGIPGVGRHLARVLANEFGNVETVRDAGVDRLRSVREVGPETAESIASFFADERNRETLSELLDLGVSPRSTGDRTRTLEGLTIVVTGSLDSFAREEAKAAIEERGGRATSSVSGQTDYLVVGENPGSKLDDAREHDVETIDEEAFKALLRGERS